MAWLWELPPGRSEAWTPDWAPKAWMARAGISHPHSIQWLKAAGFLFAGEKRSLRETHRLFIHSHSPWAPVKGGQCILELPEENLEWQALGRDMGEQLMGSLCQYPCNPDTAAAIFLEKSKPLSGEKNHPTLWNPAHPHSGILLDHTTTFFLPPCILTLAEKTAT